MFWSRFAMHLYSTSLFCRDRFNSSTAVELDDSVPHWIAVSQITQTAPRPVIYDRPSLHKLGGIFAADLNEAVEHFSIVGGILKRMVTHLVELHETCAFF